jgi:replicative superfamily II helicase
LELLISAFIKRLAFGVRLELVALMEIGGVKQGRARQLYSSGYRTFVCSCLPVER